MLKKLFISLRRWGNVFARLRANGSGYLSTDSPKASSIPPMKVLGSCVIPLVFPLEDRLGKIIVVGLPYGLILGARFFQRKHSTLSSTPASTHNRTLPWYPLFPGSRISSLGA